MIYSKTESKYVYFKSIKKCPSDPSASILASIVSLDNTFKEKDFSISSLRKSASLGNLPLNINKLEQNANIFKQKMLEKAKQNTNKRPSTIEKGYFIDHKDMVRTIEKRFNNKIVKNLS